MAGMMLKSWVVADVTCVPLAACEPRTGNTPTITAAGFKGNDAAPATTIRLIDHDIEAPEVFQTSDKRLWGGRPLLGGVRVASSVAKNPERVIVYDPANGKFVIGGLCHQDVSCPGSKLQLSSDAADALGMIAGQPATVTVKALRRKEAGKPNPDVTKPLLDANLPVAGTEVATTDAAAIAKADPLAGKPVAVKPVAAVPSVPPRPGTKRVVTAAATPVASATGAKPIALAGPAAPVGPANPAALGKLIQIGIFSVEANAKRASDILTKAGVASTIFAETSHGKPLWSVTARGNAALLTKIKAAGFADAYTLSR